MYIYDPGLGVVPPLPQNSKNNNNKNVYIHPSHPAPYLPEVYILIFVDLLFAGIFVDHLSFSLYLSPSLSLYIIYIYRYIYIYIHQYTNIYIY